jgi:predicted phosphodiesterase
MSDTHGHHHDLDVPDGDVLIHAGDFCRRGSREDVKEFGDWLGAFPHPHKIAIAGNHDMAHWGIEYLEDTSIAVRHDMLIHGSPWSLPFQTWAFMLPEAELVKKYKYIPNSVDVLVTHGGPAGIMDLTDLEGVHAGSQALLDRVKEIREERPLVHIFGHIHERWGQIEVDNYRAFNVAICDFKYNPVNPCTVIEA